MEALIPIFRVLHFLGFSLILGGTIASIVLVKQEGPSKASIKLAHTCTHLLAAPGLLLLMLSGIMQSSLTAWSNFKGAGYMHAKIVLVVAIFVLMLVDIRTQKRVLKHNLSDDLLLATVKKRQLVASALAALTLLVMWLISFRPF